MPRITAEQIRKADKAREIADSMELTKFLELLEKLDNEDTSYLKEELTKYVSALKVLQTPLSKTRPEIENALETMDGFKDFLKDGVGKTNYKRLIDDASFIDKQYGKRIVVNGINSLVRLMDYSFPGNELESAEAKPGNRLDRRVIRTNPVNTYEDLIAEQRKGKNFLDPQSREGVAVRKFYEELDKIAQNNEDFKKYSDAIKMLHTGIHKPETKENLENAIKTMSDFGVFLLDGNPANYNRLLTLGMPEEVRNNGLEALNKTLKMAFGIKDLEESLSLKEVIERGDTYIDRLKNEVRKNPQKFESKPQKLFNTMAQILATRIVVDSTPGKLDSLKKNTNQFDILKTTVKLLENKNFQNFIAEVSQDPEKMQAIRDDITAKYSHGGGMEKMFKEYLLKLPAGELHNDPAIERFLPTVIDRIEELQNQAKEERKADKNGEYVPKKEMAEVLLLRNSIGVGRNQKDALKVKIPADKCLHNVEKVAANATFINNFACFEENIKEFYNGHGGEMTEKFKAKAETHQEMKL